MIGRRRATVILLLAGSIAMVQAQDGAAPIEREIAWLESNAGSPDYATRLRAAIIAAPTTSDRQRIIQEYLPGVPRTAAAAEVLVTAAEIFASGNAFAEAAAWYGQALMLDPTNRDAQRGRASALIQLGQYDEAVLLLDEMVVRAPTRDEQRSVARLRVYARLMQGDSERADREARALIPPGLAAPAPPEGVTPADLLVAIEAAQWVGRDAETERAALERWFPQSIEQAYLVDPMVRRSSTPAGLLLSAHESPVVPGIVDGDETASDGAPSIAEGEPRTPDRDGDTGAPADSDGSPGGADEAAGHAPDRPAAIVGIQTGSFRDRENAEFFVRDLADLGFGAEIFTAETDGATFYRVIVPATDGNSQTLVVELKGAGIEGFLVFDRPPVPTQNAR